jgi:putative transposase
MEAKLVLQALTRALAQRQIKPDQVLVHTYLCRKFRAASYSQHLESHQKRCSMSDKACCWNNAVVERFVLRLKHELGLDDATEGLLSAQKLQHRLALCIDGYCNCERRPSTIDHISPIDYEWLLITTYKINPAEPRELPTELG